jgi:hypothetical protein
MAKQNNDTSLPASFEDATGPISVTLKNDMMFHCVMSRSIVLVEIPVRQQCLAGIFNANCSMINNVKEAIENEIASTFF